MSSETISGLYALAIVLAGFVVSAAIGVAVVRVLCDENGYVRRWRR